MPGFDPGRVRKAAADALVSLIQQHGDMLEWADISRGFFIDGERIHWASRAVGIFKPEQLSDGAALSIRSSRPSRSGRAIPYDDRFIDDGFLRYRLQGSTFENRHNRLLEVAMRQRTPLIYFSGIADSLYQVFFPVVVENIDKLRMEALLSWQSSPMELRSELMMLEDPQKKYAATVGKSRIHQARFRANVLSAYGFRCALSRLPIASLLIAAHIIPDTDPEGQPVVTNGICMSVLHHAAFDANLIGIDPDGRVHTCRLLANTNDGPLLDQVLRPLEGRLINFPSNRVFAPDRSLLTERFKRFEAAQR